MPADKKHVPTPLPAHASPQAHAERAAVLKAEAEAEARNQPAPAVALRWTGPAGSFVPGLPTEGTGPDKSLTPAEVHARFTQGQYHEVLKRGLYARVEKDEPAPAAKPAKAPPPDPAKEDQS